MTTADITQTAPTDLGAKANRHLWGHFARHGDGITPPIITRGEGVKIFDDSGKSYIDGLSGLFVVQVGHGRKELAEAAAKQAEKLSFFPLWSYATPPAIELAERVASFAPGDLNRVFFTTGGGEAVESAWKLAKQYFKLTGKPGKHKVVSRSIAYHGTPQGALAITGIPAFKAPFEPLNPRPVGGRSVLPRRRPWRPSRAARAAADQRSGRVRRDLRHPAQRPHRGRQQALDHPPKRHAVRRSSSNALTECRFGVSGESQDSHESQLSQRGAAVSGRISLNLPSRW
ncbi:aminotransferase class III [Mycolicibacterium smegmatis]|nr:aminotransferase class III [Mycolicibacterium smegmatis]